MSNAGVAGSLSVVAGTAGSMSGAGMAGSMSAAGMAGSMFGTATALEWHRGPGGLESRFPSGRGMPMMQIQGCGGEGAGTLFEYQRAIGFW